TSVTRRALEPTQLLIEIATPEGQRSGLRQNSVVNCVNLLTLYKGKVLRYLGSLPDALMQQVNNCLKASRQLPYTCHGKVDGSLAEQWHAPDWHFAGAPCQQVMPGVGRLQLHHICTGTYACLGCQRVWSELLMGCSYKVEEKHHVR